MRIAAILALITAVPLAFVVVMTETNTLQNTARTVVPSTIDPIFGPTTFIILLLSIFIAVAGAIAAVAFIVGK